MNPRSSKALIGATALAGLMLGGAVALFVWADEEGGLAAIKAKVRDDFPTVTQVSVQDLKARLDDTSRPAPLLLDVRRPEEFAVSTLPGAVRIDPGTDPATLGLEPDREIVVFCSVGYRSSRLAARMQGAGFKQVANLEGSIFEWAETGYPLVQGESPAYKVHPYSRAWAWLVAKSLRAYRPEDALDPAGSSSP